MNKPEGEFRKNDLYAFAYDRNMTWLAHPARPELVGQNWIDKKDWAGGKYFRREIQQVALSKRQWVGGIRILKTLSMGNMIIKTT